MYQNSLIVHGGVNENGEIENRWHAINLLSETCEEIQVEGDIRGLCYHGCVWGGSVSHGSKRVFHEKFMDSMLPTMNLLEKEGVDGLNGGLLTLSKPNAQALPITTVPVVNMMIGSRERDMSGEFWAYIFGGMTAGLELVNDLWHVDATMGSFRVSKVHAAGMPPQPRYAHGMTHLTYMRAIAVFGGIGRLNGEEIFFNDLTLFFLSNSTWTRIKTDSKVEPRAFMGVAEYGSGGVIIFGGTSTKNFIDAGMSLFKLTNKTHAFMANSPVDAADTDYFMKSFCTLSKGD